ncbi:MAG TPA: Holliday junction resolvase RuvX [Bacilli bacterium]|nr:Holliday junction resolvase RuvX [Bacilli bacterium]HQA55567.1 Holliday junction resolvase RuvX [Bacilli bacterium]
MKKVLGLDLGTQTLGIAKTDALGFVHGVETFRFPKNQYIVARKHVLDLLEELDITEIVLGLPLHLSGEMSEMANNVTRFRDDLLAANPHLEINLVDERLSSVSANTTISQRGMNHDQRKQNVDKIAACVILDTYIRTKEFKNGK